MESFSRRFPSTWHWVCCTKEDSVIHACCKCFWARQGIYSTVKKRFIACAPDFWQKEQISKSLITEYKKSTQIRETVCRSTKALVWYSQEYANDRCFVTQMTVAGLPRTTTYWNSSRLWAEMWGFETELPQHTLKGRRAEKNCILETNHPPTRSCGCDFLGGKTARFHRRLWN